MQQAAKDSPSSRPAECWTTSYIIVVLVVLLRWFKERSTHNRRVLHHDSTDPTACHTAWSDVRVVRKVVPGCVRKAVAGSQHAKC